MPPTKCAHCQKTNFEAVEEIINNISVTFVRCSSCQTAISAINEGLNSKTFKHILNDLEKIKRSLNIN